MATMLKQFLIATYLMLLLTFASLSYAENPDILTSGDDDSFDIFAIETNDIPIPEFVEPQQNNENTNHSNNTQPEPTNNKKENTEDIPETLTTTPKTEIHPVQTNKTTQEYNKLRQHLLNFMRSFNDQEQNAIADKIEQQAHTINHPPTPPTTTETNPKAEPKETTNNNTDNNEINTNIDNQDNLLANLDVEDDDFADFLEPETENTTPTTPTKKQDNQVPNTNNAHMGNCQSLPSKLDSCQSFSCSMPKSPNSNKTLYLSVRGKKNNKCKFISQLDDNTPTQCDLTDITKQDLSQHITKYMNAPDKTSSNLPNTILIDCSTKKEIAKTTETKNNKKNTSNKSTTPADKAYFDMLDTKKQQLDHNKRLSEETQQTMDNITSSLQPKSKSKKTQPPKRIIVDRSKTNPPPTEQNNIKKSTSMDISVRNNHSEENQPKINLQEKIKQAYNALIAEQISASISIYKEVLEQEHDNKEALFGLATAYHRNNQFSQARAIYTEILQLEPNNKEVLNNFLVLAAEEAPENAILELQKLERVNSEFSPIPAQIAMIYLKINQPDKAERYLRRAVILSPNNIAYKYNLAITSDRLKKYYQAIRLYKQIIEASKRGVVIPGSVSSIMERLAFLEATIKNK